MVEHWLNLWRTTRRLGVPFEIVNASRPASSALDAAAIVDYELGRSISTTSSCYGFGNGIYVADALVRLPPGVVKGQPPLRRPARAVPLTCRRGIESTLASWSRWSAAASFLRSRMRLRWDGGLSPEPCQAGALRLNFPPDIDEGAPDPGPNRQLCGRRHLMAFETYLQCLNRIDAIARRRGIRLLVSTFRIMAFDGMLLGKGDPNDGGIYDVINEHYWWPYTYAQIHRVIAFYNRTLRAWAAGQGARDDSGRCS